MKPIKAPHKIDHLLRSKLGFGFGEGYYQAMLEGSPLVITLHFGKYQPGALINIGLHYPVGSSGVQINPIEIQVLNPDGTLLSVPDLSEKKLFWDLKQSSFVNDFLEVNLPKWICILNDFNVMIRLYDYLLKEKDTLPAEFKKISNSFIYRKETPVRLLGKACYLSIAGKFDESKIVVEKIPTFFACEVVEKLLSDYKAEAVVIPEESVKYLLSIGASNIVLGGKGNG